MTAFRLTQPKELFTASAHSAPVSTEAHTALNELLNALPNLPGASDLALKSRLQSLQSENDEALLFQELLALGQQWKSSQNPAAAHFLFSRLTKDGIPQDVRKKAQSEADAIEGKGASGMRAEFLLSRFTHDATDARLIAPMLAATLIGQCVGTAALGRLMGRPASWITRGFGAEIGAGTLGYGVEVASFAGLNHVLSPVDTGPFSHDLARAALTIGVLKLSGAAAQSVLARPGIGQSSSLPFAVQQGSAFMGLVASHKLEEHLGLRPRVEGSTFLLDTLSSLVSLGVGAHLGHRALGNRFAEFQGELGYAAKLRKNSAPEIPQGHLAPALAGGDPKEISPVLMMSIGNPPGSTGGSRPSKGTSWVEPSDEPTTLDQNGHISVTPAGVMPAAPSMPPDPFVGQIIDGRYRIDRKIGFGGMGVVYAGTHQIIGKRVALKVLRAEHAQTPQTAERFLNEAKAASLIGNPHIIDINDFGRLPDGSPYFVMEFLEGAPLYSLVEGEKPLAVPRLVHIARQVAEGLAAAHNKGIVHRDLKPDNIFLINKGQDRDFAKILDFGIAKMANDGGNKLTRAGDVFGTPQYMSPEQAAGTPVDRRGDIYSFGIILYELASGRVPFDSENVMSILNAQMYKQPTPLHELVPLPQEIPPGLEAIIMKCLSKRAELRYQSMEELIVDLDKLSMGLTPAALPEMKARPESADLPVDFFRNGATPPGLLRSRRHWPLFAGIGIGGASILAAAFFALSRSNSVAQPNDDKQSLPERPAPDAAPVATTPVVGSTKKRVEVSVDPVDAHVLRDGEDLGINEVKLEIAKGEKIEIEIKREGYKSQKILLDGSQEHVEVKLEKEKTVAKPRPSGAPTTSVKPKPKPKPSTSGEVISPWK